MPLVAKRQNTESTRIVSTIFIGKQTPLLPPVSLAEFPRLIDGVPLRFEEAEIIGWLNDALAPYNPNAIERLPQVNRADRTYLLTLPCLDPYREQRAEGGWLGPVDRYDFVPRSVSSDRLFAYFQEFRVPDTGEYLTRNVNAYPLAALLLAGVIGYGTAYLIHRSWQAEDRQ